MRSRWILLLLSATVIVRAANASEHPEKPLMSQFPDVPPGHFAEATDVPSFWVSSLEAVGRFLDEKIRRGSVETIGMSAADRPIRAVLYGEPRRGKGTTTFSGSLGFQDVRAYLGPDHEKTVLVVLGAVHGGEFEGIAGAVNLLAVLETGRDLRGVARPDLAAAAEKVDRLIVVPIVNVDGRARIPLAMQPHRGTDKTIFQYLNTGARADGTNLGWPMCKEFIPMDFMQVQFPGGYPNDAGVNIQHDDFFSTDRQPETQALFDLCARERPDLLLNMHTGAPPNNYYMRMHHPFAEPALDPVIDRFYRLLHTRLTEAGLQGTSDVERETEKTRPPRGVYNLDTALNLHCGVLSVTVESAAHGFSGQSREGEVVKQDAGAIVDAQLVCHRAALEFLATEGGRSRWTAPK